MDSVRAKNMEKQLLGVHIGGWKVLGLLGNGKSALVFKAEKDGQIAALKIFDPELVEKSKEETQLERIQRERSLIGKKHPHLISILDGGKCENTNHLYVVMECLEGRTLNDVLKDIPRIRIWEIISQIAEAAKHLEKENLAHRDIKTDNVMIDHDFKNVTLMDLGVIRPIGHSELTDEESRLFIGTNRYSPPEYLNRIEEDSVEGWRAITFYQMGTILHDLIMGYRIFKDSEEPPARLMKAIEFDNPTIDAKDVSPNLILLAKNCLSKKPELRLKLVCWEDFMTPKEELNPVIHTRERVRKRVIAAKDSSGIASDKIEETKQRKIYSTLGRIQERIQNIIRDQCIASGDFPPLEVHDIQFSESMTIAFYVFFQKSSQYGLSEPFGIFFEVTLLDINTETLDLTYLAAIGPDLPNFFTEEKNQKISIYKGVMEESVLKEKIEEALYFSLESAQIRCESGKISKAEKLEISSN